MSAVVAAAEQSTVGDEILLLQKKAEDMKEAAGRSAQFSEVECEAVLSSLYGCLPLASDANGIDWSELEEFLEERAHLQPKDWPSTTASAALLKDIVGTPNNSETFRKMFEWVLKGGNWHEAKMAAQKRPKDEKPWAVLVMGVNGIRKTTSVYQEWFTKALGTAYGEEDTSKLPSGHNSFFRQLDYMIATLANEEFYKLYDGPLCDEGSDSDGYSKLKDAIFARYRTIAEALGILLLEAAKEERMNVFVETSGRDIASFSYMDQFFPDDSQYKKLVVNFSIDDIKYAEQSVNTRMKKEMADGRAAVLRKATVHELITINAGGPYGSAVLKGIQSESTKVWDQITASSDKDIRSSVADSWQKVHLSIHGNDLPDQWTVTVTNDAETFSFHRL